MAESFLISLREGLEATLVISIVLGYARRTGDRGAARLVWVGAGGAVAVAIVAGVVLHVAVGGLTGEARSRTFAATCLAAGALLTWMVFWMAAHGRQLRADLEQRTDGAVRAASATALVAVAFTAALREGLETALFLLSAAASADGMGIAAGTALGLLGAGALGVLIYRGTVHLDLRRFFQVTGALLILFAAGLAAKAVFFAQAAGDLGSVDMALWDVTDVRWLTTATQSGRFLEGILGWDPRPSLEQVLAYAAYLVPVGYLYFRGARRVGTAQPA